MVEEACSAMVDPATLDPATGIFAGAEGAAELICPTDICADNPANKRNATKPVENNLIPCLRLRN